MVGKGLMVANTVDLMYFDLFGMSFAGLFRTLTCTCVDSQGHLCYNGRSP